MITDLSHLQMNVHLANLGFYSDLMMCLGWNTIYADNAMLGVKSTDHTSLWFSAQVKEVNNDYYGSGMNHIGVRAPSIADADAVCA